MMLRRTFFRRAAGAVVGVLAAVYVPSVLTADVVVEDTWRTDQRMFISETLARRIVEQQNELYRRGIITAGQRDDVFMQFGNPTAPKPRGLIIAAEAT